MAKACHTDVVKRAKLPRCLRQHQLSGGDTGQESSVGVYLRGSAEAEPPVPDGEL
jgi:hypothetical protein